MRYVQYNQNTFQMIGTPGILPMRWTTPAGATINNFNLLPRVALFTLGWVPVIYEDLPDNEGYYNATVASYDEINKQFIYPAIARDLSVLLQQAERDIDQAASEVCSKYLSTGIGQDLRYAEKSAEAKAYFSVEYHSDSDYPVMLAEAEACGVSLAEKAAEIAAVRDKWISLCAGVEALRIGGKRACAGCNDAPTLLAKRDWAIAALGEL